MVDYIPVERVDQYVDYVPYERTDLTRPFDYSIQVAQRPQPVQQMLPVPQV